MIRTKQDDTYQPNDDDFRDYFHWLESVQATPQAQEALHQWEAEQNAAAEALIDAAQEFAF